MKSLFHHEFSHYMLPLRTLNPQWKDQYRSALDCWTRVWTSVHDHFKMPGKMNIDAFLRQDEGTFLFHKDKCIAIILFRVIDFNFFNFSMDSYFKDWSKDSIDRLLQLGSRIFVPTNLSVDPDYRNYHPELKFKQFSMNIMVRRFLQSQADVMINTSRRDRGVNDESIKRGGRLLAEDVLIFDGQEHVDLISFTKDEAHESRESLILSNFTQDLWDKRHDWMQQDLLPRAKKVAQGPDQYPKAKTRKKVRVPRAS